MPPMRRDGIEGSDRPNAPLAELRRFMLASMRHRRLSATLGEWLSAA
jgi:hypothetical protein